MFKSDCELRLKNIFGINRIIFDAYSAGKEQEAIFVDIDDIYDYAVEGDISLIVIGRLEICGPAVKMQYGWIRKKIETAKLSDTDTFIFGRKEIPIKFTQNNNEFVKYSVDFVYRFFENFNPKNAKITGATINLEEDQ